MLQSYAVIGMMILTAIVMGGALLVLGRLIRPHRPNPAKNQPYESGVPDVQPPRGRYTSRFYIVAMLFVIFDIEAIFFFPWAVLMLPSEGYPGLGWPGFISMGIFAATLFAGLVYVWKKGVLDWNA
jgi:NADH-quinone oxidoreductase subunit A